MQSLKNLLKENKILVLMLSFGFVLRLIHLTDKVLGIDEAYSIHTMKAPISDLSFYLLNQDFSSPLYGLISNILYNTTHSVLAIKLLSVVCGVLIIYFTYALAKELFNKKVALIAAALTTINPLLFFFSQHMRGYILLTLVTLLLSYCLIKYIKQPNRKQFYQIIILSILATYLHYIGLIVITILFSYLIIKNLKEKQGILKPIAGFIAVIAAFLPWLMLTISNGNVLESNNVISRSFIDLFYVFYKFSIGANVNALLNHANILLLLFPLILGLFLFGSFKQLKETGILSFLNYFFWGCLISTFVFAIFFFPKVFYFRYLSFLLPFFILITARGLSKLKHFKALLSIMLIGWLAIILLYFTFVTIADWQILFGL